MPALTGRVVSDTNFSAHCSFWDGETAGGTLTAAVFGMAVLLISWVCLSALSCLVLVGAAALPAPRLHEENISVDQMGVPNRLADGTAPDVSVGAAPAILPGSACRAA